jgi:choline dehydrogenase
LRPTPILPNFPIFCREFLAPVWNDPRLTVKLNAQATKIIFSGTTAVGVQYYERLNKNYTVANLRNPGEVILTAGAIRSPHLLLASGVGPVQQLQDYNIPVVSNVPGVGRALKDHINVKVIFSYVPGYEYITPPIGKWSYYYRRITSEPDLFGTPDKSQIINLFVSSKGNISSPNLQIEFDHGSTPANASTPITAIFFVTLQRVKTQGSVTLQSNDSFESPKVVLNTPVDPDDIEDLAWGVEFIRQLVRTSPLSYIIGEEIAPAVYEPSGLRQWIRDNYIGWTHYTGTCPVGELNSDSVVDTSLRVKSISNVRVADASVLIHSGNGNVHNTVMTVALRCSDMILESRNMKEEPEEKSNGLVI